MSSTAYVWQRRERLALLATLASTQPGARALLLEGPPGCGKSAMATAVSVEVGAPLFVCQVHAWTSDEDFFVGVDVAAAVAGDSANVRQPGVLALVADSSRSGQDLTVLLIDELDKASERVDALLLDVLESGRVPIQPGKHKSIDLAKVLVIITSNGERDVSDALRRRCRSVVMAQLGPAAAAAVIAARTRCTEEIAALAWRVAAEIRGATKAGAPAPSPAEVARMVEELQLLAGLDDADIDDARAAVAAWAGRGPEGPAITEKNKQLPTLWGQVLRSRRTRP